jgi:hypothetical protein
MEVTSLRSGGLIYCHRPRRLASTAGGVSAAAFAGFLDGEGRGCLVGGTLTVSNWTDAQFQCFRDVFPALDSSRGVVDTVVFADASVDARARAAELAAALALHRPDLEVVLGETVIGSLAADVCASTLVARQRVVLSIACAATADMAAGRVTAFAVPRTSFVHAVLLPACAGDVVSAVNRLRPDGIIFPAELQRSPGDNGFLIARGTGSVAAAGGAAPRSWVLTDADILRALTLAPMRGGFVLAPGPAAGRIASTLFQESANTGVACVCAWATPAAPSPEQQQQRGQAAPSLALQEAMHDAFLKRYAVGRGFVEAVEGVRAKLGAGAVDAAFIVSGRVAGPCLRGPLGRLAVYLQSSAVVTAPVCGAHPTARAASAEHALDSAPAAAAAVVPASAVCPAPAPAPAKDPVAVAACTPNSASGAAASAPSSAPSSSASPPASPCAGPAAFGVVPGSPRAGSGSLGACPASTGSGRDAAPAVSVRTVASKAVFLGPARAVASSRATAPGPESSLGAGLGLDPRRAFDYGTLVPQVSAPLVGVQAATTGAGRHHPLGPPQRKQIVDVSVHAAVQCLFGRKHTPYRGVGAVERLASGAPLMPVPGLKTRPSLGAVPSERLLAGRVEDGLARPLQRRRLGSLESSAAAAAPVASSGLDTLASAVQAVQARVCVTEL